MAPVKAEEALQRAVVQLLALYEQRGLLAYAHVPNGGWRSRAEAGRFRAMGVRAGVPDLIVWTPRGHFQIELKAGKGRLSEPQADWHSTMSRLGHFVYVCRSVEDVLAALILEAVPPIGTLMGVAERKCP